MKRVANRELWETIAKWIPLDEEEELTVRTTTQDVFVNDAGLFYNSMVNILEDLQLTQQVEAPQLFNYFATVEDLYLYFYLRLHRLESIVDQIAGNSNSNKHTHLFAKEIFQNTRHILGKYVSNPLDAAEKKEIIRLLKTKKALDEIRNLTYKKPVSKKKPFSSFLDDEDDFLIGEPLVEEPLFEEPLVEEIVIEEPLIEEPQFEEPMFELEFEVEEPLFEEDITFELPPKEKIEVSKTDYYAASIKFRAPHARNEIEVQGLKEVKKLDKSVVDFARELKRLLLEMEN